MCTCTLLRGTCVFNTPCAPPAQGVCVCVCVCVQHPRLRVCVCVHVFNTPYPRGCSTPRLGGGVFSTPYSGVGWGGVQHPLLGDWVWGGVQHPLLRGCSAPPTQVMNGVNGGGGCSAPPTQQGMSGGCSAPGVMNTRGVTCCERGARRGGCSAPGVLRGC